jgi:hypothetical protein
MGWRSEAFAPALARYWAIEDVEKFSTARLTSLSALLLFRAIVSSWRRSHIGLSRRLPHDRHIVMDLAYRGRA